MCPAAVHHLGGVRGPTWWCMHHGLGVGPAKRVSVFSGQGVVFGWHIQHPSLWLFYHRTDVFASFVNRSVIVPYPFSCCNSVLIMKNTPIPRIVYATRIYYLLLYRSILSRYSIYCKSQLALTLTQPLPIVTQCLRLFNNMYSYAITASRNSAAAKKAAARTAHLNVSWAITI